MAEEEEEEEEKEEELDAALEAAPDGMGAVSDDADAGRPGRKDDVVFLNRPRASGVLGNAWWSLSSASTAFVLCLFLLLSRPCQFLFFLGPAPYDLRAAG